MKRNLLFHFYPSSSLESHWRRHIEQLRRHQSLFDGRIVIGVVLDQTTVPLKKFQSAMCGVRIDSLLVRKNDRKLGETQTFNDMLRCVQNDAGITFRGHTKGVRHPHGHHSHEWAWQMWYACMDISSVEESLRTHVMTGILKCSSPLHTYRPQYDWFYAGSFYWFRNADVFSRQWECRDRDRYVSEVWPSFVCRTHEGDCLSTDDSLAKHLRLPT